MMATASSMSFCFLDISHPFRSRTKALSMPIKFTTSQCFSNLSLGGARKISAILTHPENIVCFGKKFGDKKISR
jgi:hypothetical protein